MVMQGNGALSLHIGKAICHDDGLLILHQALNDRKQRRTLFLLPRNEKNALETG